MKKRSERRKHCALAAVRRSQKVSSRYRPIPGDTGRPKFSHQFGEDRCTQFLVIVVTDPQTHSPTDRTDYNTLHRSFASA